MQFGMGNVSSIDKVANELTNLGDDLELWIGNLQGTFFKSADEFVVECQSQISEWMRNQKRYDELARENFLLGADNWLIAHAMAYRSAVVTVEKSRNSYKKFTIPDVCAEMKVNCIYTFEMLNIENAVFILKR